MQVWDSAGTGFIQYDTAHLPEATMGHVAENGIIQHALMEQFLPTVDRLWPVSALSCPSSSCKCNHSWQPLACQRVALVPAIALTHGNLCKSSRKLSTCTHELLAAVASEEQNSALNIIEVGCWCAGNAAVFAVTTLLSKPIVRSAQTHPEMHYTALLCATSAVLSIMLMPHHINPTSP